MMQQWFRACLLLLAGSIPACAETFLIVPFFNVSDNRGLDWIGESFAETIREALVGEGILVVERDDRQEAYRRLTLRADSILTKASVIKLGETVDADKVIFGQFEWKAPPVAAGAPGSPAAPAAPKTMGSLHITAELLDIRRLKKGAEFDDLGALEDLAALQNHIAWRTLRAVLPSNTGLSEEDYKKRHPLLRVDAVENYIRGLLTRDAEAQIRLFTQAWRLDARYTQPCFQLGRLHWQKKNYKLASEWFEKVGETDPHFREATFLRGVSRFYLADYTGAQGAFERVAKEVPLNEVLNNLGAAQARLGSPAAVENFRKAVEGDNSDPVYHFNLGYALWRQEKFEEAAESFKAALERDPNDSKASLMLERCQARSGPKPLEARSEGLERLKHNYQEAAYWQLRALLEGGKR